MRFQFLLQKKYFLLTLPSLNGTNISNNMFFDYKMAYNNNESSSMLDPSFNKKRYYNIRRRIF
jgi:hypothetical protein